MIYGYARVSTDGQSVDAQLKALHAAGAEKIIRETASGAKSDRAGLRRVLDGLDAGDVLAAERLGSTAEAVRYRAIRGKWPRRRGNDGRARVQVPDERPDQAGTLRGPRESKPI
jgi:Resolvase, N terminal domain